MTTRDSENKAPCPHFPECGGCDFLDLTEKNYRELKQNFLTKTIADSGVEVGAAIDWKWVAPHSRRKIIFQIDGKNNLGFFAKKSKSVVAVESCFVAEKKISDLIAPLKKFLQSYEQNLFTQVSTTLFDNGLDLVFFAQKELNFSQIQKLIKFAKENSLNISQSKKVEIIPIFFSRKNRIFFDNFEIDLDSNIFIQATKFGLSSIAGIITDFVAKSFPNEKISVADLYAGFGAYSFALLGTRNSNSAITITAFEGESAMVASIAKNSKQLAANKINALQRDLFANPLNQKELKNFDLILLNPPRNGAGPQIKEIAKLDESSKFKALIYVSCNPQTFFRDAKILEKSNNFKLSSITAIDQFYATKHLELVGIFTANFTV